MKILAGLCVRLALMLAAIQFHNDANQFIACRNFTPRIWQSKTQAPFPLTNGDRD